MNKPTHVNELTVLDEPYEKFFGMSAEEVPNFEKLLSAGVRLLKAEEDKRLFFSPTEIPQAFKGISQIVERIATDAGWTWKLLELAIIEDEKRVHREPYFLSIVCCRECDDDFRTLNAYDKAISFMKSENTQSEQIVPSLKTYKRGVIWSRPGRFPEHGDNFGRRSGGADPSVGMMIGLYHYHESAGDSEPADQVRTLLGKFYAELPEPEQSSFKETCFLVLPFIRPFYQPARMIKTPNQTDPRGTPGGVFFGFFEHKQAGIEQEPLDRSIKDLSRRLSLALHRSAAVYSLSASEAKEKLISFLEFVGHEFKNSIEETGWHNILSKLGSGPEISKDLSKTELRQCLSRLWLPSGLGAAMRNIGSNIMDRDFTRLRKDWLDDTRDAFSFTEDKVNDYRNSLSHLFSVLASIYSKEGMNVVEGQPPDGKVARAPIQGELDPWLLHFPPLRQAKDRMFQAPLTLAAILAEPVRNAVEYVARWTALPQERRMIHWFLEPTENRQALRITIWNEIQNPDHGSSVSGIEIVKTLGEWLGIVEINQPELLVIEQEERRWFRPVEMLVHPQKLGQIIENGEWD